MNPCCGRTKGDLQDLSGSVKIGCDMSAKHGPDTDLSALIGGELRDYATVPRSSFNNSIHDFRTQLRAQQTEQARTASCLEKLEANHDELKLKISHIADMEKLIMMKLERMSAENEVCLPEVEAQSSVVADTNVSVSHLRDATSSLQKSVELIKRCQEERDHSLRVFIQQELQSLTTKIISKASFPMQSDGQLTEGKRQMGDGDCEHMQDQMVSITSKAAPPIQFQVTEGKPTIGFCDEESQHNKEQTRKESIEKFTSFVKASQSCDLPEMLGASFRHRISNGSFWFDMFQRYGYEHLYPHGAPITFAAQVTEHYVFTTFQALMILANTVIMAYEADLQVRVELQESGGEMPRWFFVCNITFTSLFAVELLFRMLALRMWFWVCPHDWAWNWFDTCLVLSSFVIEMIGNFNVSYLRAFRILRVVRVARVIRVMRFFRQLRQMLFAILACLRSLVWTFLFMATMMFMFAICFLQGLSEVLHDMSTGKISEDSHLRSEIQRWYGGLMDTMLSLLAAVTGGMDWIIIYDPLTYASWVYPSAFVIYMLFVVFGLMNVLTGVFMKHANEFVDVDLIVQDEHTKIDIFVEQIVALFHEMNIPDQLDWDTFSEALKNESTQALFQSLDLQTSHARFIFQLLDQNSNGVVSLNEFAVGMMRLRGGAKAVDSRAILHELGMLPMLLK